MAASGPGVGMAASAAQAVAPLIQQGRGFEGSNHQQGLQGKERKKRRPTAGRLRGQASGHPATLAQPRRLRCLRQLLCRNKELAAILAIDRGLAFGLAAEQ